MRRFFGSGLIVLGHLSIGEKLKDFFYYYFFNIGLIIMGDLPIDERYKDIFLGWSNFHGRPA
jgi:hypothetical protein